MANEPILQFTCSHASSLADALALHQGQLTTQTREANWQASAIWQAVTDGAVYVDGKRVRDPLLALRLGQRVAVMLAADPARQRIDEGLLRVVHRDARMLVVAKPAGLPTQPPPRGGDALSLRVQDLLGPQAYLGEIHRLDRDASGLVVFALDRVAAAGLAAQFRSHNAGRRYLAVVRTQVPVADQTIDEPIVEVTQGHMATGANGVPAITRVRSLGHDAQRGLALLDLQLYTGRSHQIRAHLAWAVGPIVGDRKYGDTHDLAADNGAPARIALHGGYLAVHDPDGRRVKWTYAPPADFWPTPELAALLPTEWPPPVRR